MLSDRDDGRDAYFFETNPAGLRGDGLLTGGQGFEVNKSWNGIWDVEVSRDDYGWSAEIRIPFRTLQFNPNQSTWGINFQRTIRVRNEEILTRNWRYTDDRSSPLNSELASKLTYSIRF